MNSLSIGLVILFALIFPLLLSLYRRRQGLAHRASIILRAEAAYIVTVILGAMLQIPAEFSIVVGMLVGVVLATRQPARSRNIPASVRRQVIARWQVETGEKFNPKKYEVHHVIPFSQGGSSTLDNLRVVSKKENRSRGDRSPWWDVIGGK